MRGHIRADENGSSHEPRRSCRSWVTGNPSDHPYRKKQKENLPPKHQAMDDVFLCSPSFPQLAFLISNPQCWRWYEETAAESTGSIPSPADHERDRPGWTNRAFPIPTGTAHIRPDLTPNSLDEQSPRLVFEKNLDPEQHGMLMWPCPKVKEPDHAIPLQIAISSQQGPQNETHCGHRCQRGYRP